MHATDSRLLMACYKNNCGGIDRGTNNKKIKKYQVCALCKHLLCSGKRSTAMLEFGLLVVETQLQTNHPIAIPSPCDPIAPLFMKEESASASPAIVSSRG